MFLNLNLIVARTALKTKKARPRPQLIRDRLQ